MAQLKKRFMAAKPGKLATTYLAGPVEPRGVFMVRNTAMRGRLEVRLDRSPFFTRHSWKWKTSLGPLKNSPKERLVRGQKNTDLYKT